MLTLIWPFSGPPFPILPGGLQPILPFTSKFILRLSGSVSVLDPTLASSGHFNQKCLDVGTEGRSRTLRDARMSQRAGGGRSRRLRLRGLPGAVPTRTSPPPGGVGQRPPDGAEKVQLSGIRGISGEQQKVMPESAPRATADPPHLLISLSALGRTVCPPVHLLRTASQPQAIRPLFAHHIAHVSHAACVFLFQLYIYYVCKSNHPSQLFG